MESQLERANREQMATAPLRTIHGFVDEVTSRGDIVGWSAVSDDPSLHVNVSIYEGAELIAFGVANQLRPDIRNAGYGDGHSGFSISLPEGLNDGRIHNMSVHFEATGAETLITNVDVELAGNDRLSLSTIMQNELALLAMLPLPGSQDEDRPPPIYVPGYYVNCSSLYPPPAYHTAGWHAQEDDFTWIDGLEATIEMTIRRPRRSYTFLVEVVPNGTGGRVQTLEVFLNYFRVGFFEVQRRQVLSILLPSELFILRRTRICLHCRNALVGTEFGVLDTRRLGIAVCGWGIV